MVLPVWGTLRGAGDEKVGRCFEGGLVEGVGVAMAENTRSACMTWTKMVWRIYLSLSEGMRNHLVVQVVAEEFKGDRSEITHLNEARASQGLASS